MLYAAVLSFALGAGIATVHTISYASAVWLAFLGFVLAVVGRRQSDALSAPYLFPIAILLLFLAGGILRTELYETRFSDSSFAGVAGQETMFSGVVVREPDQRERNTHLYIRSGEELLLVTVDRHTPVAYGDELVIAGEVEEPESFETEFGRTFDYPDYLLARGVTHTVSFAEVAVIGTEQASPVISFLLSRKHQLMQGIESAIVEPQAGLAEGLLLGVKQALGDNLETAFRQSGIIHIVVLSGYNVMLVVAFVMFFLSPLPRKTRMVAGVFAISGFALIVGLSATVVRACIMAALFLFADTFSKTYNVLRALFVAGFVMIFINPFLLLYDIGFQLSFMATLGLVLVAPYFEQKLAKGDLFGTKEYLVATIATQVAVLPLLLYHIGEISLVAIIVNMLVLPVVPLAMFGGFVSGALALVSLKLAMPFAFLTNLILVYIITVASWFASLPFATLVVPAFHPLGVLLLYMAMGAVYFYKTRTDTTETFSDWDIKEESEVKSAATTAAPNKEVSANFR